MSIFNTIKFNYKVTSFCSLKKLLTSLGIGKCQLISECFFGVNEKKLTISAQESEQWSNQQNKDTSL